jgi:hypothetical protein
MYVKIDKLTISMTYIEWKNIPMGSIKLIYSWLRNGLCGSHRYNTGEFVHIMFMICIHDVL